MTSEQSLPYLKTVQSLITVLLPSSEKLGDTDEKAIEAYLLSAISLSPILRFAFAALVFNFNVLCFFSTARIFSQLSFEEQNGLINHWQKTWLRALVLRITALPFKLAYVEQGNVKEGLCIATDKQNTKEEAKWQQQISSPEDFEEDEELEADVVIIGTGAGGAPAAYELASQGLAVVLIEEGRYHERSEFTGNIFKMVKKLYRLAPTATIGNHVIPVPIGRSVGGSTTINSGTTMRVPEETLEAWQNAGLKDFTSENLEDVFQSVEEVLCVQQAEEKHVGQLGEIIRTGASALGFTEMGPLQRNAEGCDGQGLCQFGCPSDAKKSTNVSYIPKALDAGAFLFTGFKAESILKEKKRSQGVVAVGINAQGKKVKLRVKAGRTIVAMGSFYTPVFLKKNGVKNKFLGKNLSLHPAGVVTGLFKNNDFENTNKIPQGYGVKDWRKKGLMFEGGTPPFLVHALGSTRYGQSFVKEIESYQQTAYFGVMLRDDSRGRVISLPGLSFPLLWYWLNKNDYERLMLGIKTLAAMYLRAGADEVYMMGNSKLPPIKDLKALEEYFDSKPNIRQFLLTSYHPLGTAKIGADKSLGVCDDKHQVYGHEGLYVMDGSSVPSALGVNPQVTIMAMSVRAARLMAEDIKKEQGLS